MREIEYKVSDYSLAKSWFDSSSICMEEIIKNITVLNDKYGFNLYNNDEDLEEEMLRKKITLKYDLILNSFVYQIEKLLKSFLITYMYVSNPNEFIRNLAIKNMNKVIRQSQNSINSHDLLAMINYIDQNIDNNFVNYIANEYALIRDKKPFMNNPYSIRSTSNFANDEERIQAATQEYTQGFINFRYLFEKEDKLSFQPVDTEKIIEYGIAIRNCVGQEINRMHVHYGYPEFYFKDIIINNQNAIKKHI